MAKGFLIIMISCCLTLVNGLCQSQTIQTMKQSSVGGIPVSGLKSLTGSGSSATAPKGVQNHQSLILSVSADDTVKVAVGGTRLLTKADFLQKIWNYEASPKQWIFLGDKPAIIDFYAGWCGPCKIAAPILEEVSNEFAGVIDIYRVDTEKELELASVFGIRSIPAFLYIPKAGKPAMSMGIARTKEETYQMFTDNINKILLQRK
jgi:thioredoxin 1